MYVYVMYAESNEVLYVGKTRDMKSRMNQHFGVAKESWKEDVSYIKYLKLSDFNRCVTLKSTHLKSSNFNICSDFIKLKEIMISIL